MADNKIYAYNANYLPLLSQIMQQMELPNTINKVIGKEGSQATVDTGTIVAGLILNILSDSKIRLYLLPRFFADKPMPLLFPWNPESISRQGNSYSRLCQPFPLWIWLLLLSP